MSDDERTAYHETGHVDDRNDALNKEHHIGLCLAGGISEGIAISEIVDSPQIQQHVKADIENVDCTIRFVLSSRRDWFPPAESEVAEYRRTIMLNLEAEVRKHWEFVKLIAEALMNRRSLTREDLAEMWRQL